MQNNKFYFFLIICFVYNLFISNKGTISFGDENIYYESVLAVEALTRGNINEFSSHINNSRGRPGEAMFRIIPATIQGVLYKVKGISPANLDSLRIPIFFNILMSILVLYVLYKIAYLLFSNTNYALLTVVLYKLLTNSTIYIRHIFPYEKSLLCFLFILYLYFKRKENGLFLYFTIGVLCAFSFTIYPGYYFIPVFLGMIVFTTDVLKDKKHTLFIKHGISIFSGFLLIIVFFELFSRIGTQSYLQSSSSLAETIDQGSFDESLIFPLKYLISVEGIKGVLILFSIVIIFYLIIRELIAERSIEPIIKNPFYLIFIFSLIGILFHGILGTVFHKMVFYGRLMHLYFPILILCFVYVCSLIKNSQYRNVVLTCTTVIFFIHFVIFSIEYNNLGYPKNMLYNLKIDNKNFSAAQMICESAPLFTITSPNPLSKETNAPYSADSNYLLLNCCYYFPLKDVNDYRKFTPEKNQVCIIDKPHYQTFQAYMMEGYSLQERFNISKRKYRIRFYKTN